MKGKIELLPVTINTNSRNKGPNKTDNIQKIGAHVKWEKGIFGNGITIAIIDSGIDIHHKKLQSSIKTGYNFSDDDEGNISIYQDYNGHGTHIAGIISKIAPKAKLLILKVLNKYGSGTVQALIDSINYAIDWRGTKNERVRVISLSLGMKNPDDELHKVIKRAIKNNISVVVSVGNEGDGDINTEEISYPAGYQEVIGVGAINNSSDIANFSNTNKEVDIYAPGVDIYSTFLNNEYATLSGTSMAAPHVTGALALLIEEYEKTSSRQLTEQQVFELLMQNTKRKEVHNITISELLLKNENIGSVNDRQLLLQCFCEARKTQAFYTKCLSNSSSKESYELLIELVQNSTNTANRIKEFCEYSINE
ncbi:S8 family peptidase [Solibacillus sp. CAU 1738]|uniref:S8 family peptidase n=1 Tax=Solibacillus sp. CAU 1738 TaxID=3140363 RepID=UPI003260FB90